MVQVLNSDEVQIQLKTQWILKREGQNRDKVTGQYKAYIDDSFKKSLINYFDDDGESFIKFEPIQFYPMLVYISNDQVSFQKNFEPKSQNTPQNQILYGSLSIEQQENQYYWKLQRSETKYFDEILAYDGEDERFTFLTLNELIVSDLISSVTSTITVLGLYVVLIVTVGQMLKSYIHRISQRVIYEEIPQTDELFDLCQGIYTARKQNDIEKEEYYYEILIKIYKSPEILRQITGDSLYQQELNQYEIDNNI
ncbi:hypothetical protein PPERSA_08391 [Pseudocohnilembus persalinus]|uniref:Piezo non-specific cation channel cap domain-containing protein n=1 Tax=Pseudocohnilembus persalinus TaxID=266149 RepID=A0A0V0R653_PSEPJ|nr:hypothetical protein PPERSA_08391 [Pseudocohnilembus persalinus]|eukprot:KRX09990.1 hypothetical protein PPERSA_08391 [Pseudocohnilembus persalinus]